MNHVTKRIGLNLKLLVREYRGRKLDDDKELSGKGCVTISRIDAILNFYICAISDYKNKLVKME